VKSKKKCKLKKKFAMRLQVFFIGFLLLPWCAVAQNFEVKKTDKSVQNEVLQAVRNYSDAIYSRDWDRVAGMIYPGLYRLSSREEIIRALENGTSSLEYRIEFHPVKNYYIYPEYAVAKNGEKYVLLKFRENFTMIFNRKNNENDLTFKGRMDYMYHLLSKRYGQDELTRGSRPGIFHFSVLKYMLAIYLPDRKAYTFIDFRPEEDRRTLLEQIIDPSVLDFFAGMVKGG
jgi:hypothetical protein